MFAYIQKNEREVAQMSEPYIPIMFAYIPARSYFFVVIECYYRIFYRDVVVDVRCCY